MVLSNNYHIIEQIGQGGMGVVYRVVDRLSGKTVALKKVTAPTEHLQFASSGASVDFRVALAHEFRVLASLRHPNIISVLDYGFDDDQQPYFTMELLENQRSILAASQDRPLEQRIGLLMQAIQALIYLHRRKIIHRDLKPDNVIVLDDVVKVVDFGLAVAREYVLEIESEDGEIVGTLAYMAPEVLQSIPASEQSDLYAVGIMAYELIAGHHPFDVNNPTELIQNTLLTPVDVSGLPVGAELQMIVARLLAKSPQERFESALSLYDALVEIAGQTATYETPAIRKSFLEAAAFVGRDSELQQLIDAMERARLGQGGVWLVGGESGIGKSRLLEEMRIQALSQGMLVFRGQAVMTDGGAYEVWRHVLRRVCLRLTLSDFEASVLKALVPDIATLLERPVVDPEEIDPSAAQDRLFNVIESLLKRVEQPLLILLEDLHWAQDSLPLLRHMQRWIGRYPLIIVGSYRSEEAPLIPEMLPDVERIQLSRLDLAETGALSESILGPITNREPVVNFLHRETEGNVFFIIEVLRELAEDSGKLSNIGLDTLPKQVFAGGMKIVVQRRLSRVPPESQYLLHVAALAGREIDMTLLSHFASQQELDPWLMICEIYNILEIQENTWRFAHDKLREGAVQTISEAEQTHLHGEIGDALVTIYGERPAHAARIAYHYRRAGRPAQEAHYTVLAGKQALAQAAYNEAKTWFERALELADAATFSTRQLAEIEQRLMDVSMGLGQMDAFVVHARRAVTYLGFALPATPTQARLHLIRMIGRQFINSVRKPREKAAVGSATFIAGVILQESGAVMHVALQQTVDAVMTILHSINLLETVEHTPELVTGYASLSVGFQSQKLQRLALHYLNRAERLLPGVPEDHTVAFSNMHRALGYAYVFRGEWKKAIRSNALSADIFEAVGDVARYNSVVIHQSVTAGLMGNLAESRALRQKVLDGAEQSYNLRAMTWGLVGIGQMALYQGELDVAADAFTRREAITQRADRADEFNPVWSYRTALYWRSGDIAGAHDALTQAQTEIGTAITLDNAHDIYSIFNIAEVAFGLLELDPNDAERLEMAARSLEYLREYTDRYPVGEPRWLLYTALYQQLTGKPRKAQQTWIQTRQRSKALQMPFEQALAYYYSGLYELDNTHQRDSHFKRARQILHRIGARWDLARVPSG